MAAPEYLLALDYGEKRVGAAIAHFIARLPRPLTTLPNDESLFDTIGELVVRENIRLVVVGLPRGLDGGHTAQTRIVEHFAVQLAEALSVPVELTDETLTSIEAESILAGRAYQKSDVDALAASLILERYLAGHPAEEASI